LRSIVIADAGPLIALSRIDAMDLLRGLFGQVLVTEELRDEALPAARPVLERLQPEEHFSHPRIVETVLKNVGE